MRVSTKCFKYRTRPKSYITVSLIDEPYGENSEKVVSVGSTLSGDTQNPTWKVHVPIDLAEDVGAEIIRLAHAYQAEKKKSIQRHELGTKVHMSFDLYSDDNFKKEVHNTTQHLDTLDFSTASKAAIEEGRVIKRVKKES